MGLIFGGRLGPGVAVFAPLAEALGVVTVPAKALVTANEVARCKLLRALNPFSSFGFP
jgi:hypothetical protein